MNDLLPEDLKHFDCVDVMEIATAVGVGLIGAGAVYGITYLVFSLA